MLFFFFNDTATTEIYTLSLHDALPISPTNFQIMVNFAELLHIGDLRLCTRAQWEIRQMVAKMRAELMRRVRSEEHTSELQSQSNLVCRLLLEKKNVDHAGQARGEAHYS